VKEGAKHLGMPLISNHQPTEVLQPGDGAFDFPASPVAAKGSPVLCFDSFVAAVGTDQFDAASLQPGSQGVVVGGPIVDQSLRILPRPTPARSRHGHLLQRRFDQRAFVRRRRGKLDSERHTLAVCHHHKLCTLAAFGLANLGTPFLPRRTCRRRRPRANRVGPPRPVLTGTLARSPTTRPRLPIGAVDANRSSPMGTRAADLSSGRRCAAPREFLPSPPGHRCAADRPAAMATPAEAIVQSSPIARLKALDW
jgi:hypothetical protein